MNAAETTVYVQNGENNYTSLSDVTFEKLYSKDGRYYVEIKGAAPANQTIYVKNSAGNVDHNIPFPRMTLLFLFAHFII